METVAVVSVNLPLFSSFFLRNYFRQNFASPPFPLKKTNFYFHGLVKYFPKNPGRP
ncbi:hypothetical protein KFK09_024840 [Dendrobium nobile]|uniref:Uncharacterized protein n=1 Tax=Dendrobium nobile TaxID=94219 RepID=A0A8T3AE94_DENNO|nr:hypothetical protein KFK09_024840 [Dendrobium nobile]